jgi:hypothetical protein
MCWSKKCVIVDAPRTIPSKGVKPPAVVPPVVPPTLLTSVVPTPLLTPVVPTPLLAPLVPTVVKTPVVPTVVKTPVVPTVVKTPVLAAQSAPEVLAPTEELSVISDISEITDITFIKEEYEHTESESYSIETEDGRSIEIESYVNRFGVRMVEILADIQIPLTRFQNYIGTIVESSANKDQVDTVENTLNERLTEFDKCMNVAIAVLILLLIAVAVTAQKNQRSTRLEY